MKVANNTALLTIVDNDPPPFFQMTAAPLAEGQTSPILVLSLNEISEKVISLSYQTADGTATIADGDYVASTPASATLNPGDTDITISIQTANDADVCEFNESVLVGFTSPINLTPSAPIAVMITDNDDPSLSLSGGSALEGTPVPFTATLSALCPSKDVSFDWHTVPLSASVGQDFVEQTGTVTIPAGQLTQNFQVTTANDTTREINSEYFTVGARNKINLADTQASAALGEIIDDEVGVATVKVIAFGSSTCALSSDGQIKCWGSNRFIGGPQSAHYGDEPNEMGDNLGAFDFGTWDDDANAVTPEVPLEVVSFQSFGDSALVLLNNGRLKGFGYFTSGSYGDQLNEMGNNLPFVNLGTWDHDSNTITPEIPYTFKGLDTFSNFSSTYCAHLVDDSVKCFGTDNAQGVLGLGVPYDARFDSALGNLLPKIDFGTWDHDSNVGTAEIPLTVKTLSTPCVLLINDRVKCWGSNSLGELGLGDTNHRGDNLNEMGNNLPFLDFGVGRTVKYIDAPCVILDNDDLKCWGANSLGELGLGDTNNRGDNSNEMGDLLPAVNLGTYDHDSNIITPEVNHFAKKVFVNDRRYCAILDDDRLKCWGAGSGNILGNGSGSSHGNTPATTGNGLPYVNLGTGRTAKFVGFNYRSTFVIRDDNSLVGFGTNRYGELGLENQINKSSLADMGDALAPINLGTGLYAVSLSPKTRFDFYRICAVLNNGQLKCWGQVTNSGTSLNVPERMKVGDDPSEMGAGLTAIQLPTGRTAKDIFPGTTFTRYSGTGICASLDDDSFVCWGEDGYTTNNPPSTGVFFGDRPNTMGNSLRPHTLSNGKKVIHIYPRHRSTCALDEDLELSCWGINSQYLLQGTTAQLGFNPTLDSRIAIVGTNRKVLSHSYSHSSSCVVLDNYTVKCWGNGGPHLGYEDNLTRGNTLATSGDNLPSVNLGTVSYPVQISSGLATTCARFANGGVKCWGRSNFHTLGYGDTLPRGGNPGEMGNNLPFINLGTGLTAQQVYHIGDFYEAMCAKRNDLSVVCWGHGGSGRLGNGSNATNIGDQPGEMGNALVPLDLDGVFQSIESKSDHACTLLADNRIKCWGDNQWGQLGLGDTNHRGDAPGEMGVALPAVDVQW